MLVNGREPKLDYIPMCETMKNLGFITNIEKLGGGLFERERTLLLALWWALKGEELGGVTSRSLCLFSLGILGLLINSLKTLKGMVFPPGHFPKMKTGRILMRRKKE